MPMRRVAVAAVFLIMPEIGYAVPSQITWSMIERNGLSVEYPVSIFAIDEGPADRGVGRNLASADGSAGFGFYIQANEGHETPASYLKSRLPGIKAKLDYTRVTDRFVAVSGTYQGRIYYGRCNFPTGAYGPLHCIDIFYRESEKRLWDPIVTRISLSLQ
jgi:hypothetical protein